jgi:hypothetical protein
MEKRGVLQKVGYILTLASAAEKVAEEVPGWQSRLHRLRKRSLVGVSGLSVGLQPHESLHVQRL